MTTETLTLKHIEFRNYKAFKAFSMVLRRTNVLTGRNNCGKSTIIGALRLLEAGIRRAHARRPEKVRLSGKTQLAYPISQADMPVSLENVHTDYSTSESEIIFSLSDKRRLALWFPRDGGAFMLAHSPDRIVTTPTEFAREFRFSIVVVPTLGPVDHSELLVERDTVQRSLRTHRAATHFRNYWHYNPDNFPEFAAMLAATWPGTTIEAPEFTYGGTKPSLSMFCTENRITRELYWAGFGFQVWCQALSHVARAQAAQVLAIDEPEIYLHPELQRQLFWRLQALGPDVILATHSSELINEADPHEILVVDKSRRQASRLKSAEGVQIALRELGSTHNTVLSQLSRARCVLFVEGDDMGILRAFCRKLGIGCLTDGTTFASVPIGGFSSKDRMLSFAWGLKKTLVRDLRFAAILDRDYYSDEEVNRLVTEMRVEIREVHVHERKELENYVLVPSAIRRSIETAVDDRMRRGGATSVFSGSIDGMLSRVASNYRDDVLGQMISKRTEFLRKLGKDVSTTARECITTFGVHWATLEGQLRIVPGKQFLSELNVLLQKEHKVALTPSRIVSEMLPEEIPDDLVRVLRSLDKVRTGG